MKIGIVTPGGFDRSGRERVVPVFLWLVERLAREHEVHVYTLYQDPTPDEFALLGATIHNVGYGTEKRRTRQVIVRTLQQLRKEHARGHFDILHGLWAGESGFIAALAGRLWRLPSVVTVAGGELVALPEIGYGGQLRRNSQFLIDKALRMAHAVTTAAEFTFHTLKQRRPDARLITLGADTQLFTPRETPLPGPPWRLIHVASLNRVKDQPTLLRAFARIHAEEPETHLDIVGEDTLNGEIQRYAAEWGIAEAVTFHGFQPSDVVAQMLKQSHLLLHSSVFEDAGPLVFLEAGASGVPTVGTAVGLIDDLAPEAAVAVPVGDEATMASAALELLRDTPSRDALALRILAFARERNADWTADQFKALYRELQTVPVLTGHVSTANRG